MWNCCCSVRTWYDRDDPAPGGFCYGGVCKCVDIMLSSHISIVSHSALFRFLWFRLFCFVLPCCVILCFGGIKPPWGGFIPPKGVVLTRGGGFIPHKGWLYPPKGVVLSPKRGGFIPHKSGHTTTRGGFKGGFIPHLGVVLRPGPTHYHNATAAVTTDEQAWLSPLFHTVPSGHPAHIA